MSSPDREERETSAPSVQHGKEPGEKDGVCQRPENQDELTTTSQSEFKENGDYQEDVEEEEGEEEEEVSTSLSVGDGRHLVDLGSPSEFIVDEECIIQLLRSCRVCNSNCVVETDVRGLKLTVSQTCRSCKSRFIWTNLPEEDEEEKEREEVDDFSDLKNGEDAAPGQTSITLSPGGGDAS